MQLLETEHVVHVDRSILPVYGRWVTKLMHPELEGSGPTQFEARKLELWRHPKQNCGVLTGTAIYEYMEEYKMVRDSLGLRDLEEIQRRGIAFFRLHFGGKAVFGWKSTVMYRDSELNVPYLAEDGDEVLQCWRMLRHCFTDKDYALRFPKIRNVQSLAALNQV